MEGRQKKVVIYLIHAQGFFVETSDEWPQDLIISLFYGQQARRGTLVSLSPNEIINKQLA